MSENNFEYICKSVQSLEAGSTVTFNGIPMVVENQTTTYNRYYAECRWLKQLDGTLDIDVTLRVGIKFDSEVTRLKAEVERFKFTLEEERQIVREDWAGLRTENARLKAEVDRLTKAGDKMAEWLDNQGNYGGITDGWHKAKGVQS